MRKHSPVFIICDDLIITDWQCFCIFIVQKKWGNSNIVKSMEAAQKGWFALYDKYADGKLEREFFLNEKKKYDADMEQMEAELAALKQTQEAEESVQDGSMRKAEQAMVFLEEDELTEDMKEKLIEKVIVYPENRIEVMWRFREQI